MSTRQYIAILCIIIFSLTVIFDSPAFCASKKKGNSAEIQKLKKFNKRAKTFMIVGSVLCWPVGVPIFAAGLALNIIFGNLWPLAIMCPGIFCMVFGEGMFVVGVISFISNNRQLKKLRGGINPEDTVYHASLYGENKSREFSGSVFQYRF